MVLAPVNRGRGTVKGEWMPRYLVERSFPDGLGLPAGAEGVAAGELIGHVNQQEGVTWIHSYVSRDKKTTFCLFDSPNPDLIRRAAQRTGLPIDRITEVRVLDPFFYY